MRDSTIEVTRLPLPTAEAQAALDARKIALDARKIANDAADRAAQLDRDAKIAFEAQLAAEAKSADANRVAAAALSATWIKINFADQTQLLADRARTAVNDLSAQGISITTTADAVALAAKARADFQVAHDDANAAERAMVMANSQYDQALNFERRVYSAYSGAIRDPLCCSECLDVLRNQRWSADSAKNGAHAALVSAQHRHATAKQNADILASKAYIAEARAADALADQARTAAVNAAEARVVSDRAAAEARGPRDLAVAARLATDHAIANWHAASHDAEAFDNKACDAEYAAHTASLAMHRAATEARVLKHCTLRPEAEPVYTAFQSLQDYGAWLFIHGRSKAGLGAIYFANTMRELFNSLLAKESISPADLSEFNDLLRRAGQDMSDHTSVLSRKLHLTTSRGKLVKNIETHLNFFWSKSQHMVIPTHETAQPASVPVAPSQMQAS